MENCTYIGGLKMVMVQDQGKAEEKLWWVRYTSKRDLARQDEATPEQGNAFFCAIDEEALHKHLAGWQRYIKHDGVVVQAIEQVPLDFRLRFETDLLQELPTSGRIVALAHDVRKGRRGIHPVKA